MKRYDLDIKKIAVISIYTDVDKVINKLNEGKSITKTIPVDITYVGDVKEIEKNKDTIIVLNGCKKTVNVNPALNQAVITVDENGFFFPDLVYLTISMFANILQEKGCYFVQSSVVKYDDEHSVMFIGNPNSGKTSMAYSLMKKYGYSLVSNDNVLLGLNDGKLVTLAGTKTMQMRLGAIKAYFPEVIPYVKISEGDINRNDWDIKIYIDECIKENDFRYSDNSIVTDIYNIKTYKDGDIFIKEREEVDQLLLIYEELTKQIRSNRYAMVSFDYPLPSFESNMYVQDRYDISKQIVNEVNIYDAFGPVKELTKRINSNYGKK